MSRRRFRIVDEDTRFEARLRPGPPGVIPLSGMSGEFSAAEGPDGLFDLSEPVEGTFRIEVRDLDLGNRVLTAAVKPWLGGQPVIGRPGAATARDDGDYEMELFLSIRGIEHRVVGTSWVELTDERHAVLHGRATVRASDVGLRLPAFLAPHADLDWDMALELLDRGD